MADKYIQLMSFEPNKSLRARIYTVDLPPQLKDNLFELLPPKGKYPNLMTSPLKQELRCWLDQTVSLRPVAREYDGRDWIVALRPINLEHLCNILANWLNCSCDNETRESEQFRPTMRMLEPSMFEDFCNEREIELFDSEGRPASDLSFGVFSALATDLIVDKSIALPTGVSLSFSQVASNGNKGWELVSNVQWHKEDPWGVALNFHLETLPTKRAARLNLNISARRYIRSPWSDEAILNENVNAYVGADGGTFRVVPYLRLKREKRNVWDDFARRNYESCNHTKLPAIEDYLANMASFAEDGHKPQILSPYSMRDSWAKRPRVGSGIPIPDKAMIFEAIASLLEDIARPTKPLKQTNSKQLKPAYPDATKHTYDHEPEKAYDSHRKYASSNRKRLAVCTGCHELTIEILGTHADRDAFDAAHKEIDYFLGEKEVYENVTVHVKETLADELLGPLAGEGEQAAKARWANIREKLGTAKGLTACIVLLPGPEGFVNKSDPKQAIRFGLAKTNRLSQFLIPNNDGKEDNLQTRARAAVRDLMRQLGFIPQINSPKKESETPPIAWGITLYQSPRGKKKLQLPLAVRLDPMAGQVTVASPLFGKERLPYPQALLRLAKLSTETKGDIYSKAFDGNDLKKLVDIIREEATSETLLLVHSYANIRRADWWPGLSDKSLAGGTFTYGPTKGEKEHPQAETYDSQDSQLAIMRVRNGSHKEVPDYYTEKKGEAKNGVPIYYNRQGIFLDQGYVLGLAGRTSNTEYSSSYKQSKFDHPNKRYAEKTLNEYYLLTPGDMDKTIAYAKYAESLRGLMVELVNTAMRVNQPAPLHFSDLMGEYIWTRNRNIK
ncbi:MAG: DUF3962 domain-containing protein [Coriobacteriales bacterium]|nr:DUF3962 domain-containing protein [Coriobacteriales bacterium]